MESGTSKKRSRSKKAPAKDKAAKAKKQKPKKGKKKPPKKPKKKPTDVDYSAEGVQVVE